MEEWTELDILELSKLELEKLKRLGDSNAAVVLYHVAGYLLSEKSETFMSDFVWWELCNFISDSWDSLDTVVQSTIQKEDLSSYDYSLCDSLDQRFEPGKHYLPGINNYVGLIKDSMLQVGAEESWFEVDKGVN
jgi:hypothetical protein